MPSLRRLTALLSALLLLQLTLLGADWRCGPPVRPADRAHDTTTPSSHGSHDSHDASSTRTPSDACDVERALGTCATMTSCATVVVPASVVPAVALVPASDALPEPVQIHSQPATGPDVPPPRG